MLPHFQQLFVTLWMKPNSFNMISGPSRLTLPRAVLQDKQSLSIPSAIQPQSAKSSCSHGFAVSHPLPGTFSPLFFALSMLSSAQEAISSHPTILSSESLLCLLTASWAYRSSLVGFLSSSEDCQLGKGKHHT